LNSPDKHKPHQARRLLFAFLSGGAYDLGRKGFISSLEGLALGGQFLKSIKVILSYFDKKTITSITR
jgi:hypothetical protein